MANTIDTRMLSIPEVREALLEADDFPSGTNPIEGISMLQLVFFTNTPSAIKQRIIVNNFQHTDASLQPLMT